MIKIEIYIDPNLEKHTLSTSKAIISLLLYLLVMILGGTVFFLLVNNNPNFMQTYNDTDSLISTLQTKNGVGIVKADEFNNSFIKNPNVDIYIFYDENVEENGEFEFLKNYLLITSKGVYIGSLEKNIDASFIRNIFKEKEYYNNNFRVYRFLPNSLVEDKIKTEELFTYFNVEDPIFDYKTQETTTLNSLGNSLANFVLYFVLIVGLVIITFNVVKADFLRINSFPTVFKNALIGLLLVYGANILSNMLSIIASALFRERVIESANQMAIVDVISSSYAPLMIFTVVLLGPIVEELVFRKAIFSFFKDKKLAIIISSLAFGLIHVLSESSIQTMIISLFPYLLPGIVLGYIYAKNDENIIIPMVTHILLNSISIVSIFLIK